MRKIRKGDNVQVMRGKSKGHRGIVLSYKEDRVIVDNAHTASRHVPVSDENPTGIRRIPVSIHASKVMLIDPQYDKPTRAGFKFDGDTKYRFAKKSDQKI